MEQVAEQNDTFVSSSDSYLTENIEVDLKDVSQPLIQLAAARSGVEIQQLAPIQKTIQCDVQFGYEYVEIIYQMNTKYQTELYDLIQKEVQNIQQFGIMQAEFIAYNKHRSLIKFLNINEQKQLINSNLQQFYKQLLYEAKQHRQSLEKVAKTTMKLDKKEQQLKTVRLISDKQILEKQEQVQRETIAKQRRNDILTQQSDRWQEKRQQYRVKNQQYMQRSQQVHDQYWSDKIQQLYDKNLKVEQKSRIVINQQIEKIENLQNSIFDNVQEEQKSQQSPRKQFFSIYEERQLQANKRKEQIQNQQVILPVKNIEENILNYKLLKLPQTLKTQERQQAALAHLKQIENQYENKQTRHVRERANREMHDLKYSDYRIAQKNYQHALSQQKEEQVKKIKLDVEKRRLQIIHEKDVQKELERQSGQQFNANKHKLYQQILYLKRCMLSHQVGTKAYFDIYNKVQEMLQIYDSLAFCKNKDL